MTKENQATKMALAYSGTDRRQEDKGPLDGIERRSIQEFLLAKDLSVDTVRIVESIREQIQFKDWDKRTKQVLSLAMFPDKPLQFNGAWTTDGRQALNLLRHMIKRGHFITAPAVIRLPATEIGEHLIDIYREAAARVRVELLNITGPWPLDNLI